MRRLKWPIVLGVPPILLLLHILSMLSLDETTRAWYLSEHGPSELLTAALFLASGIVAIVHLRRFWKSIPALYRVALVGFALAAILVAVEEVSYGQSLVGYHSPAWFAQHNNQEEFNLHNLAGDKPSRFLRRVGEIGLPIFAVLIPLVWSVNPTWRARGSMGYHLIPGFELVSAAAISIIVRVIWSLRKTVMESYVWTGGLSEFQELMWAFAALVSILVIHERPKADVSVQPSNQAEPGAGAAG